MKRCLMSLIIEKCKSKPPWDATSHPLGWLLSKNRNNKCWQGYEVGILVHWWWRCKMVQPPWKTVWQFFKKLKIELPYDPEIPLLGIYLKERNHYLTALFAIAKTWKQTSVHWQTNGKRKYAMCVYTHPPTHNGTFIIIQKYWLLFERKKSFICDSMHGPWGHYLKRNKSEKDKYCMISLICGI